MKNITMTLCNVPLGYKTMQCEFQYTVHVQSYRTMIVTSTQPTLHI